MARKEIVSTQDYTYTVVFDPEPEGGFTVTVPARPGCISYGKSMEEARRMASEAIEGYLEALCKAGKPIPAGEEHPQEPLREAITVKLAIV